MDEPTFRVSELTDAVQLALDVCFPDELWVQGEISSLKRSANGHVYFQLIEPGPPGTPARAQIAVTLFAPARASVNATLRAGGGIRMTDGVEIRIRGRVMLYGAQGRLQLRMSAIDPDYTLGRLAGERDRLLQALRSEGLLERNAALAMPARPWRIGLLTSAGSAAEADFLHELTESGLSWHVVAMDARVQGAGADRALAAGLRQLAAHGVEVIALIRGGGARTDLATFDSEVVARAITGLAVPVLTGIGHEIDTSVADLVAHTVGKTPTACAARLVARVGEFEARADRTWQAIATSCVERLDREDRHLADAAAAGARNGHRALVAAEGRIGEAARRLIVAAPRAGQEASLRLDTFEARVAALDPRRALERGWSITRTLTGSIVRRPDDLAAGDVLVTTLWGGTVHSQVLTAETDGGADSGAGQDGAAAGLTDADQPIAERG